MCCKLVRQTKILKIHTAIADKVVASIVNNRLLVQFFSCFCSNVAYVTLMEYIRGVDLHKVARVGTVIDDNVSCLVIAQLGFAINYMHSRGLMHRDIKVGHYYLEHLTRTRIRLNFFFLSPIMS